MTAVREHAPLSRTRTVPRRLDAAAVGLASAVVLMALAAILPAAIGWHVHALGDPPLRAYWQPRVGWGTAPAVMLAVAGVCWGSRLAETLEFFRLLAVAYVAGFAWLVALATVDGSTGLSDVFARRGQYLYTARQVRDISATLHHYTANIAHVWPVHVAGHPPGALLLFVALVHLGLGTPLAVGWTVVGISATTPVAVLLAVRRLGAEAAARRAAPLLVLGPSAMWSAVSADAIFAAVTAWALCCLAYAASASRRLSGALWSLSAGLLLGYCALLSYGLVLLALPAAAVLISARAWRRLPAVILAALAVVFGFYLAGFAWWDGLRALHGRYYDSIARVRPWSYWVWGDLAALCFAAGPILGAGLAAVVVRLRRGLGPDRAVVILAASAALSVLLADVSLLSKAEVERIWLPFVPWLLLGVALLPGAWRRWGLAGQVAFTLGVQSLLFTLW